MSFYALCLCLEGALSSGLSQCVNFVLLTHFASCMVIHGHMVEGAFVKGQ